VPGLLVEDHSHVSIRPVDGLNRRRDIYALVPPGDRHPLTRSILDAMRETAVEFNRV
jgi:DNA-binding transcriptional LysR family regulator